MALPTKANLETLDYSYGGVPFVSVAAKAGIDLDTLDYSYAGVPFGTSVGLFILSPTPACRTYVIKGDGTSSVIAANETYLLTKSFWGQLYWPANYWAKAASLVGTPTGREWNVNAENREYAVLMENRTYSVPYCTDDD